MPAGLPLTQARRIAADSSRGLPLTHAPLAAVGGEATRHFPQFTPPSAAHRPRRSREITQPSVGKANPPSAAPSGSWESQPPSAVTLPAAGCNFLQPRRPCRCVVKPARLLPLLSSQPVMVSPPAACRIDKPAGRGRILTRL